MVAGDLQIELQLNASVNFGQRRAFRSAALKMLSVISKADDGGVWSSATLRRCSRVVMRGSSNVVTATFVVRGRCVFSVTSANQRRCGRYERPAVSLTVKRSSLEYRDRYLEIFSQPARKHMAWKAPKIVEVAVGMEINMYACAQRK